MTSHKQTKKKESQKINKNNGNRKEGAGKQNLVQITSWSIGMFQHHDRCFCWKEGENVALMFPAVKRGRANEKNKEDC